MASNFVVVDDEGWFEYTCTGCGAEIRFGPYNIEKGTEQFHQAQREAEDALRSERWSSTQKCLRCQARRRARQAKASIILTQHQATPKIVRKKFGLGRARYTAIDGELHSAAVYFQHLAAEIDTNAMASNKHKLGERAEAIRKQIEQLRRDLDQAQRQQGEA